MNFVYSPEKDEAIIEHENKMIEVYTQIIKSYAETFNQYGCTLKVELGWSNHLKDDNSSQRLPFENGYSCYIYCYVERDGKVVQFEDEDEDGDYNELSACWSISSITRFFFHLNVYLYEDKGGVNDEMNSLLAIL